MAHRVIGTSPPRADAWEKVRGRPIYAGDLALAGMLHGRIVRSPYASARILRLDTRAARALHGVAAVLTARDVPRNGQRMELPGRMAEATAGAVLATQPVLAGDRARFQGEPVVAIAASTPEIAAAAADLVEVEYAELPGVYDPLVALAPDAPRVHDSGNLLRSWHLRAGDITQGFARADVVVEHTYRTPFVDHVYLETESGIGWIDGEGVLVLRVSTQVLEHYRDVAEVLQLPHGRVRLEGAYLGGGFGGKEDVTVECLLGLLVWKTGRPVQLVFSREESFIGHGKRHPYVMRYRTGATRDGTLVALDAELISDSGAYAALSPWVLLYSLVTSTGPYRIPNVKVDATTVYTNNPVASAYRCFGSIQTCLAYEGQMDALAEALHMDPLALREKNFLRKGDALATGQALETEPMLAETMRRAWAGRGERRPARAPARIGGADAASFTPYGRVCWARASASAWVGMELDGTAVVRCAAPDVGGGQTASLCSITAEVLGLPVEHVVAVGRDSHFTPRAGTTTATRQLINRQSAEGQIEGGAVQGLGHALMEEVALEEGINRNPHLLDYRIPTTLDSPPVETILLESGNGLGPFGAKGIGEPAMTPTPA